MINKSVVVVVVVASVLNTEQLRGFNELGGGREKANMEWWA